MRRLSMSGSILGKLRDECCTTVIAAGKSAGNADKTWLKAFIPPAEAQIATTLKAGGAEESGEAAADREARRNFCES